MRHLLVFVLPALVGCGSSSTGDGAHDGGPRSDAAPAPGEDAEVAGDDACASCPDPDPCAGDERCIPGVPPDDGALFSDVPSHGSVEVTLWPGDTLMLGEPQVVSFGVPFPRGTVSDPSLVRVVDASGAALPSTAEPLLVWRSLGETALEESLRSALVHVEVTFASRDPLTVHVVWGRARDLELAAPADPTASWVAIADGEYPASEGIREPAVYATLPADWLGRCLLRSRAVPFGADPALAWFDDVVPEFGRTAVNDVDPRVTADNRIDYVGDAEPWLFDRALTLFGLYVRSGELRWLRHAHRAAQFYARHIDGSGFFDLKPGDLKYAYGQPMVVDLALFGDRSHVDRIERVAGAGIDWPETYEVTRNFWTERHQTYALLAALSAWEATGDDAHGDRVREIAAATFRRTREPASPSWPVDGCLLHTMRAHEGSADDRPICSPWMSALLGDAVFRYYIHSGDTEALAWLASMATFVAQHALYDGGTESAHLDGVMVPYYLVSSVLEFTDSGAFADLEHTCDVAGLVARGAWARQELGEDPAALWATTDALLAGCERNLGDWHRPGGPDAGLAEWRLSPPRKLNWWFGTTSDLAWVLSRR